jgi:Arc/MetJ-type ribon-helix-helix transcriptional regulator
MNIARKPNPNGSEKKKRHFIFIAVTPEMESAIDAEVDRRGASNRSVVVRLAITEFLKK